MLLLDTHVWIWMLEGNARRVGRRARALLARAESRDAIRISPVTLFEVTALHAAGRLQLKLAADEWIRQALSVSPVRIAELTPAVAIDAGRISRDALGDPMDRLLVSTARALDATFLTADRRIIDYGVRSRAVDARDAGR